MAKREQLRPEWELFVNEYLIDLNATRAAQRAGIGNDLKSSSVLGARLLGKVCIRRAIRQAFKKRLARIEVRQDDVLNELTAIVLSDVLDYEVNEQTGRLVCLRNCHASKAVQSVKVRKRSWKEDGEEQSEVTTEFRLWDKLKAIELLMRHMGMLGDDRVPEPLSLDERRQQAAETLRKIMEKRASLN